MTLNINNIIIIIKKRRIKIYPSTIALNLFSGTVNLLRESLLVSVVPENTDNAHYDGSRSECYLS